MKKTFLAITAVIAYMVSLGVVPGYCAGNVEKAVAVIHPTTGNTASGKVWFIQEGSKVKVIADIEGLTANAMQAIHVHEFGDETSGDGKSAGGHYNPGKHEHSGPATKTRHAGDLGNLTTDADGKARYEITVDNISINGKKNPILGRSVIIHAGKDDYTTQPTGNAGGRVGCGIIGVAGKP